MLLLADFSALSWGGGEYDLNAVMVGSEFCGHQTCIARSCEADTWMFSDSDAIRQGISPICFRKPRGAAWHALMRDVLPTSNASDTTQWCDMYPSGRHPLHVVKRGLEAEGVHAPLRDVDTASRAHDLINCDYIYVLRAPSAA